MLWTDLPQPISTYARGLELLAREEIVFSNYMLVRDIKPRCYHQSRTQKHFQESIRQGYRGPGHMVKTEASACLRLARAAREGKTRSHEQAADQVPIW